MRETGTLQMPDYILNSELYLKIYLANSSVSNNVQNKYQDCPVNLIKWLE